VSRVLPLIVVVALSACSKSTPAAANTETTANPGVAAAPASATAAPASAFLQGQPAQPEVKPVPAQLPDVVARVNGEGITRAEFEKALQNIEANAGGPVPAEQRDRVFRSVLDQMIGYKLLIQETKTRKLTVPDAELDKRIAQIQSQFPSEEAFKQTLTQQNVTLAQLRADARNDLLVSNMLQTELGSKVTVTPEQLDDFYKKNPGQFQQPERVRASHILIGFPQNADEAAKSQARAKAAEVLKDVKAGKDFAALAKQHSTDPGSGANGGDLGFFQQGQMVGPFDKAAFSMKPGETSELVETDFGVHIIRVVDRQPARTVPFEEVRPQIQQYLEGQGRQQATQAFVDTLKSKGKIEILI
jgi:peptidyl-prolyl cis-trans isomerase C